MALDKQSGYWVVKGGCAAVADLPSVTFVIGGTPYALPPQLWTRPVRPSYCSDLGASQGNKAQEATSQCGALRHVAESPLLCRKGSRVGAHMVHT